MLQDFRFAFRQLFKARAFAAAAIIVLGLGIGANTAIFSLMNTLLFQPPHYAKADEVVQIFSQDKKNPKMFRGFSYPTYVDIRERNEVFSGVMAHNLAMVGLGDKGNTRRAFTAVVSSNYFSVMGVMPSQGRAFRLEEETPGRNAAVAIVSHTYWKREGFNPALLGSTIKIDSHPFTVIGIMPEGFTGTTQIFAPELWLPLGVYDLVANDFETGNKGRLADRAGRNFMVVGRLKPGMTIAAAAPAMKALAANLEQAWPVEQKDQTFMIAPLSRFAMSMNPTSGSQHQATRAAAFRHVRHRPAGRLPEPGEHAARARGGAPQGNRGPARAGRESLADRAAIARRRVRARAGRRNSWASPGALVVRSSRCRAQEPIAFRPGVAGVA